MFAEQHSTWATNDKLSQFTGYIDNFILVDADHFDNFKSKNRFEEKTHIELVHQFNKKKLKRKFNEIERSSWF
jgi:hypothetical protein